MIRIKIAELLAKNKMTQKQLSELTNIRAATISKMPPKHSRRYPSIPKVSVLMLPIRHLHRFACAMASRKVWCFRSRAISSRSAVIRNVA